MGSKVSSKMAAPVGRAAVQVIRPHTPMIKFPSRIDVPKPNAQEALKLLAVNFPSQSSSPPPASVAPPLSRPPPAPAPVTWLPGTPDSLASIQMLPQRYRRRLVTMEEMEYIQRGGPE